MHAPGAERHLEEGKNTRARSFMQVFDIVVIANSSLLGLSVWLSRQSRSRGLFWYRGSLVLSHLSPEFQWQRIFRGVASAASHCHLELSMDNHSLKHVIVLRTCAQPRFLNSRFPRCVSLHRTASVLPRTPDSSPACSMFGYRRRTTEGRGSPATIATAPAISGRPSLGLCRREALGGVMRAVGRGLECVAARPQNA